MRERTDMPTSYSAGPKAEKPREPWVQDCGSGLAPQFGGERLGFTQPTLTGWNPIPSIVKECPKPFTQWVPLDKCILPCAGENCGDVRHSFWI
jgi:hypothetical protein